MYWDHWDKNRRCRSTVIADSIVRKKSHVFSHTFFVFSALKDVNSAIGQIFGQDASISITTAAPVKYKHVFDWAYKITYWNFSFNCLVNGLDSLTDDSVSIPWFCAMSRNMLDRMLRMFHKTIQNRFHFVLTLQYLLPISW